MRTHHAPNSADRERVRNALARRLENGASKAVLKYRGDGWALMGRLGHPVVAGASLGVAVALIAVTFAVGPPRETPPLRAAESRVTRTSDARHTEQAPSPVAPEISGAELLAPSQAASPAVASDVGLGSAGKPRQLRQAAPPTAAASRSGQGLRSHAEKRDRPERRAVSHPAATSPAVAPGNISPSADPNASAAFVPSPQAAGRTLVTEITSRAPLATEAEVQSGRPSTSLGKRIAPETMYGEPDGRAELALVQRMLSAWTDAKLANVLALSTEHERRWPHGTFAQEREGLHAMAECLLHVRNAGARAQRFLASFAHAPLAPRVRAACSAQLKSAASVTRD